VAVAALGKAVATVHLIQFITRLISAAAAAAEEADLELLAGGLATPATTQTRRMGRREPYLPAALAGLVQQAKASFVLGMAGLAARGVPVVLRAKPA